MFNNINSAEVLEVFLTDSVKSFYTIRFRLLNEPTANTDSPKVAAPLNLHYKKVPVKGEIVYIIEAASDLAGNFRNSSAYYYLTDINIQSNINYNGIPGSSTYNAQKNNFKDSISNLTNINVKEGQNSLIFKIDNNVPQLQLIEGDVAIEGRFGNSLRLGYSSDSKFKTTLNPAWSSEKTGPITVLSVSTKRGMKFRTENINIDDASIYLTSTQKIPLIFSFNPAFFIKKNLFDKNDLSGKQILLCSDRITLNSKTNEIIINSKSGTSIASNGNIVLESSKSVSIDASEKIELGQFATSNAVKGNTLNEIITNLITVLQAIDKAATAGSQTALLLQTQLLQQNLLSSKVFLQ